MQAELTVSYKSVGSQSAGCCTLERCSNLPALVTAVRALFDRVCSSHR